MLCTLIGPLYYCVRLLFHHVQPYSTKFINIYIYICKNKIDFYEKYSEILNCFSNCKISFVKFFYKAICLKILWYFCLQHFSALLLIKKYIYLKRKCFRIKEPVTLNLVVFLFFSYHLDTAVKIDSMIHRPLFMTQKIFLVTKESLQLVNFKILYKLGNIFCM